MTHKKLEEMTPAELEQAYQQAAFGSPPSETVVITTMGAIFQAVHESVFAEREACAKIADQHDSENEGFSEEQYAAQTIAANIRARGAK